MASNVPTKTRRIEIRITEEERSLEQAAATVNGETLSEFVRQAARREAERTLAERTRYAVDDEAAQRFLLALEQPSPIAEGGSAPTYREVERPACSVTPRLTATTAFDRRAHSVEAFNCGQESLDRWLRAYAGQSQHRDAARTFVTAEPDGEVAGYYTLVAAQVEYEQASAGVRRGLSRHFPIPVALLARLAVTTPHQGAGLGRSLLLDALQRVLRASDELAIRTVTVDALDERPSSFYRAFGFEPSDLAPNTLMLPMHIIRQTLGP